MSKLIEAMKHVNDLNEKVGVSQRGNKKYTEVFVRVEQFRIAFGETMGIDTEILVDDGKRVVIKAIVTHEGNIIGSGIAEEIRGSSVVNKTSAIENCETSAIGRALASLGLHGGSYASANEIAAVQRKEKAMEEQKQPNPKAPEPKPEIDVSVHPQEPEEPEEPKEGWRLLYHNGEFKDILSTAGMFTSELVKMVKLYQEKKRPRKQQLEIVIANFENLDKLGETARHTVEIGLKSLLDLTDLSKDALDFEWSKLQKQVK
tara:strand:- start:236 stop:1015 length:780 start_codon:yes stop_codon:yes gene_type:complete